MFEDVNIDEWVDIVAIVKKLIVLFNSGNKIGDRRILDDLKKRIKDVSIYYIDSNNWCIFKNYSIYMIMNWWKIWLYMILSIFLEGREKNVIENIVGNGELSEKSCSFILS